MSSDATSSLSDDEAALARYADQLGDAVAAIASEWMRRLVDAQIPGISGDADVASTLDDEASRVVVELRALLALDIAAQPSGPLEILRRAVRVPTEILRHHGAVAMQRDEFSVRNFPDDVYNLTPASFADVDPSLHEPGLIWGAAKAHVHLRRRREASDAHEADPAPVVVVLSADLMDRSKIGVAFPSATFVRSQAKLLEKSTGASLVLVDLARLDDTEVLAKVDARTVAFGSHVDDDVLAAARSAGAEAVPRSVFFRRLGSGDL